MSMDIARRPLVFVNRATNLFQLVGVCYAASNILVHLLVHLLLLLVGVQCQKCGTGSYTVDWRDWWSAYGYYIYAGPSTCNCLPGYISPSSTDSDYGYCVKCSNGTTTTFSSYPSSPIYQGKTLILPLPTFTLTHNTSNFLRYLWHWILFYWRFIYLWLYKVFARNNNA